MPVRAKDFDTTTGRLPKKTDAALRLSRRIGAARCPSLHQTGLLQSEELRSVTDAVASKYTRRPLILGTSPPHDGYSNDAKPAVMDSGHGWSAFADNLKEAWIAERNARAIARAPRGGGWRHAGIFEYSFPEASLTERLRSLRAFLIAFLSIGVEWRGPCDYGDGRR